MSLIEVDWKPDRRKLRQFGVILFLGFGILGLILVWRLGRIEAGLSPALLWGAGATAGMLAWLVPEWLKPVYWVWMGLAFPIGWVLSHLFLGVTYFGLFTFVAFLFRIIGRDPLGIRRKPGATSYWISRSQRSEPRRYFRQF